jgi:hypothetical protein
MSLTTHLHLAPMSRMVELYLHSHVRVIAWYLSNQAHEEFRLLPLACVFYEVCGLL